MAVRMGLGPRRPPPQKSAGYGLMIVGGIIMAMSMPLFVYAAIIGALIAYVGYSMNR